MKKIFNFGKKKGQSTSRPFNKVPSYFGVQTPYPTEGYQIRSKDLGKIHKAALLGDVAKVQQLLQLGKSTVNELDKMKRTPLHLACANGYTDLVSLLLEKKCELNLLDDDNRTPLMKAIECQQEECATILLEHGADPNLRDKDNNTILHYVACGRTKFMAEILVKYKVDIEAKNKEGLTPLLLSITSMNTELADFLLKNGANVNVLDSYKRTPLMIAVSMESLGLVTLLLQNNADYTLRDESGWTAYTYAEQYGYPLHIYHKQIEKQEEYIEQQKKQFEKEKLCPPQISCSEKPSDTEFALGASSLDKKAEGSAANNSVSSVSDKPGPDDHLPSADDELDFDMKHSHENLPGISAKQIVVSTDQSSKDSDSLGQHEAEGSSTSDSLSSVSDKPGSDDHLSSSDNELDFDMKHSHENLLEISAKRIVVSTNQNTKDSDSLGQHEAEGSSTSDSVSSVSDKPGSGDHLSSTDDELDFDMKHCHEKLLEISAKRIVVSTNQNTKDSDSLGQHEDHTGRNPTAKPILSSCEIKDAFTNQEEGVKEIKTKLDVIEEFDLTDTDSIEELYLIDTDGVDELKQNLEYKGSSVRIQENFDKRDQEQRSHENLLEISARRVLVSTNQNIKDSISLGQYEDVLYRPSFWNEWIKKL
uniref:Uncharacterized protein n=1 Tax=Sarcophilus harrisii TaxID=9305 RepID=A0A7N4Q110_SARHA